MSPSSHLIWLILPAFCRRPLLCYHNRNPVSIRIFVVVTKYPSLICGAAQILFTACQAHMFLLVFRGNLRLFFAVCIWANTVRRYLIAEAGITFYHVCCPESTGSFNLAVCSLLVSEAGIISYHACRLKSTSSSYHIFSG